MYNCGREDDQCGREDVQVWTGRCTGVCVRNWPSKPSNVVSTIAVYVELNNVFCEFQTFVLLDFLCVHCVVFACLVMFVFVNSRAMLVFKCSVLISGERFPE